MRKTLTKLTAAAFAVTLALPVHAQEEMDLDSVVATVNGSDITLGHMLAIRATLPEQYQQLGDEVLWNGILDQIVQQSVLAQDDKAEESKLVTLSLDNERRSLMAATVIKQVADEAVTDEAVQAAYDANYANAEQGQEFNASHILVETEEEAQSLVEELNGGADFAELAKEHSTGPSGPNGGELGWFGPGMMVEPFEKAVEQLEPGEISAPVKTQFGWHVVKLNDTRSKSAPALDEVRGEIEQTLQQEAVKNYIDEKVAAADVTRKDSADVDTSVLSQVELLEE